MNILEKIDSAKNIDCSNATEVESFVKKYTILKDILNYINIIAERSEKEQYLKIAYNLIYVFGYEVAYNKTFEYVVAKYHKELVCEIFSLSKKVFSNGSKDLIPFYKEQMQYVFSEPDRSILQKELERLNNQ